MILSTLLRLQRLLMDSLGFTSNDITSSEFLSTLIGLSSETSELLDLVNTKTRIWSVDENGKPTRQLIAEEAIDVLFYLLEVFEQLELDENDIRQLYLRKMAINLARLFAKHAPTVDDRKRAFRQRGFDDSSSFINLRGEQLAQLDLSTLSIVIDELFGQRLDIIDNEAFFEDPVTFMRELVNDAYSEHHD